MPATNQQKHDAGRHFVVAEALLRGYDARTVGHSGLVEVNGYQAEVLVTASGRWQIADIYKFAEATTQLVVFADASPDRRRVLHPWMATKPGRPSSGTSTDGRRAARAVKGRVHRTARTPWSSVSRSSRGGTAGRCSTRRNYPATVMAELLIDCEEDRTLRAVLVGMLRESDRGR